MQASSPAQAACWQSGSLWALLSVLMESGPYLVHLVLESAGAKKPTNRGTVSSTRSRRKLQNAAYKSTAEIFFPRSHLVHSRVGVGGG